MTELEKAREEINRIDKQLARLFEERMAAVKTVAEYKRQNECVLQTYPARRRL